VLCAPLIWAPLIWAPDICAPVIKDTAVTASAAANRIPQALLSLNMFTLI
jgi:hypothetical protein